MRACAHVCACVSRSLTHSLALAPCVCLSLSVCVAVCLAACVCVYVCVYVYVCVQVCVCERDCYYDIIVQTHDVGLHSMIHSRVFVCIACVLVRAPMYVF